MFEKSIGSKLGHPASDARSLISILECILAVPMTLDNTYKEFIDIDFTYNINKCNITFMSLFTVIS